MTHRAIGLQRQTSGGLLLSAVSLALTLLMLLSSPLAHVETEAAETEEVEAEAVGAQALVFTPRARVDSVEQHASFSSGVGVTYVRLIEPVSTPWTQVRCAARTDGWFFLPSDTKQLLQLEVLLTALDRGVIVRLSYDTANCRARAVSVCTTASPC